MRLITLVSLASLMAAPAFAFDGWHTENVTMLPSKTAGYDYISLDTTKNRLFLGHRGEGLQVFDIASHKLVETLPGTEAHSSNGAVVIPEMDLGIVNNEDGNIIPFKLSTLAMQAPIKLSEGIDTSHYEPKTKRLFVNVEPGKDGTDVVAVDVTTMKTVGIVSIPSKKAEGGVSDNAGRFYLAGQDVGKVFVIDPAALKVAETWSSPACAKPTMMEVDTTAKRLFVSCRSGGGVKAALVVFDTTNGATVWNTEIGDGSDGLAYDAATHRIFSTNGVGANMTVAEMQAPDKFRVVETLATMNNLKVIAYDPKAQKIYSMVAEHSSNTDKKINTAVSPFAVNTVFPNTFRVVTIGK